MAQVCGIKKGRRNEKSKEILIYWGKEDGGAIIPCCITKHSIRHWAEGL